jgi:serine/threonine-protein kinase
MAGSTVSDLVGRVLAGRYRLLASIGAGSSGRVFVADDVRLRRRVAVKVLHAALADDAGFLRRFRTEAQLAASLHHPNVMAVYDWGEDGVPFMVLELLAGGSLRSVLDRGDRLTAAQAAHVAREVAAALEYAHGRGLVHRDIKPANLLFDEHGILRVADFGLARALAEASWTEPAGAMLGTARYAAPEQSRGTRLDGRADLYSLGLVMVEAVSGRVPLVADTPFGTLARRQDRPVIAPREMGALGRVVERAGRSDPDERYPDAVTMGAALDDAIRRLPRPAPLPLAGLGEVSEDPHPTSVAGAVADPVFDQDAQRLPATTPVAAAPAARAAPTRRIAPFVLAGVLVLTIAGIVFAVTRPSTGSPVTVPNLFGMTEQAAQSKANEFGLLVSSEVRNADDPQGVIIGQRPDPGGFLGRGGTVHLVVSKGPKPVAVPAVAGKPAAEAKAALEAPPGQFVVEDPIEERYDETVPKGIAIGTEPSGTAVPFGPVKLVVSKGPAPVAVPNVAGKSYDAAVKAVQDRNLTPAQAFEFSDTVPEGTVTRTDPPAGSEVARGSRVTIVLSKGQDLVAVPSFGGATVDEANAAAAAAGVQVQAQGVFSGNRKVRAQDPPPGTKVKRGTVVTIFF